MKTKIAVGCLTGMASCVLSWSQEPPLIEPVLPDDEAEFLQMVEELDPGLLQQLQKVLGEDVELMLEDDFGDDIDPALLRGFRDPSDELTPGMVKTDTDAEGLLERAEAFAGQGRYDLASRLWQQAIEQSSDALIERDDWQDKTYSGHTYQQLRPMITEIEASMTRTIREGLDAYRLKIDGDARALLARSTPETRESALAEIVLRYFLSSVGDDAAFELGCLKMERGESLPAVRLFTKILDEYPASSIERPEVEIRLAGSLARVGSVRLALEMVGALDDEFPEKQRVLALVRKDIEAVRDAMGVDSMASANVTTPPTVQASLKEALLPASLKIVWTQKFELTLPQSWPVLPESSRDPLPALLDPLRNQRRTNNVPPPKPAALEDRWREFFMPAGQVLFNAGQLYFKTDDRLVACDSATGSLEWLGFRNGLPLDENTRMSSRRYPSNNGVKVTPYPNTPEEYLVFGDLVNQSMTLSGDTLYSLQGDPLDFQDEEPQTAPIAPKRQQRQFGRQLNAPGRFRENRLVAYDRTSGKLKWYRRAEEPLDPNIPMIRRAGFARAPLAYGSLLLVPVHEETSLWLSGLDRRTGETLWRTFLCDEPAGQCQAMSAVAMTVDAGEVYVSSGAGLLFSVDAISGQLAWAVRYPRRAKFPVSPATNSFVPRYDALSSLLDGWQQDRLLPHGNDVIVAGTDFDHLFAVNRRTGKLTWETARQPFRSKDPSVYVLAAHGGNVYVAGEKSVRCYQSHGGKLIWESILSERSYARCAFTPEAIYVPLESSIVQLDPATGKQVARAKVTLPSEDEPVGNLFTDGERLIVFGLKKVYALALTEPTETLN